ncbi:unnamed protein product [Nesidiocoris tenuis]|uniref:Uncharacterized protein n=1 Tax=Nesidiocoris tenuis TaxID=355587 RepID=A0A6H5GZF5_9HEMI|nr:unnamed protein product [Nesidiocoris tenuis]
MHIYSESLPEQVSVCTLVRLCFSLTMSMSSSLIMSLCGIMGETKIMRPRTLKSVHFCGRKKIK